MRAHPPGFVLGLADVSGMSKAEAERILLPFWPWIVLATAALPSGAVATRLLLAAQALVAIVVAVKLTSLW